MIWLGFSKFRTGASSHLGTACLRQCFLAHVVLSDLYHSYPAAFTKYMLPNGGSQKLKEFWQPQKGHPAWRLHPIVSKRSFDAEHTLPLQLHGDGTPVVGIGKIWSRQLTSYTWNSLLAEGWTQDNMLPSWFCFDETEAGRETTDDVFRIIAWSFNCLATGVWPAADHLGAKQLRPSTSSFFCLVLCFSICIHVEVYPK